jgi:PhnB protein
MTPRVHVSAYLCAKGAAEAKTLGGHSVSFVIEVPDVDAAFGRALDAGAKVERPLTAAPPGRGGWVVDPFGHRWHLLTPNPRFKPEDLG